MSVEELKSMQKETNLQQQFVRWFATQYSKEFESGALFSIPNQGKRSRANASRMKAEGMVAGVSDMILLVPRGEFHGAVIEFKRPGEKPRKGQTDWLTERYKDGYMVCVFDDIDLAIATIVGYMKLK